MDDTITGCEPYWTAWETQPQAERIVQQAIEGLGYGTFIPTFRQYRVMGGAMWNTRSLPVMPGYVLVALDERDDGWKRIHAQLPENCGRVRLLTDAGAPGRLPSRDVERLMLEHAMGVHNRTVHQARARNGQFTTQPRRRQRKRRPRPRPGRQAGVRVSTHMRDDAAHGIAATQ